MINFIKRKAIPIILVIFAVYQVGVWMCVREIKPTFQITPYPPSRSQIQALSLGDIQFYYYKLALDLELAGNKLGHFSPLKTYDYSKLYVWFSNLSDLDPNSSLIGVIAGNLYSAVDEKEKVQYLIKFLEEYGNMNLYKNWRYLTYAGHMSASKMNDIESAIKITSPLSKLLLDRNPQATEVPLWAKYMSLFYIEKQLEKTGKSKEGCASLKLLSLFDNKEIRKFSERDAYKTDLALASIIFQRIKEIGVRFRDCVRLYLCLKWNFVVYLVK